MAERTEAGEIEGRTESERDLIFDESTAAEEAAGAGDEQATASDDEPTVRDSTPSREIDIKLLRKILQLDDPAAHSADAVLERCGGARSSGRSAVSTFILIPRRVSSRRTRSQPGSP